MSQFNIPRFSPPSPVLSAPTAAVASQAAGVQKPAGAWRMGLKDWAPPTSAEKSAKLSTLLSNVGDIGNPPDAVAGAVPLLNLPVVV